MEPFIGQIIMFGGNFAPAGWALCDGQLIAIPQNEALFSLLGTIYGGDGETTFGLPDLRGRVPLHPGSGPGLPSFNLGQRGGEREVTLNISQIPSHTHQARAFAGEATSIDPTGRYPAKAAAGGYHHIANANMNSGMILNTGGSQAHNNMQPYLAVNFIIALVGIYPSES